MKNYAFTLIDMARKNNSLSKEMLDELAKRHFHQAMAEAHDRHFGRNRIDPRDRDKILGYYADFIELLEELRVDDVRTAFPVPVAKILESENIAFDYDSEEFKTYAKLVSSRLVPTREEE
jgi:hypothetical protein